MVGRYPLIPETLRAICDVEKIDELCELRCPVLVVDANGEDLGLWRMMCELDMRLWGYREERWGWRVIFAEDWMSVLSEARELGFKTERVTMNLSVINREGKLMDTSVFFSMEVSNIRTIAFVNNYLGTEHFYWLDDEDYMTKEAIAEMNVKMEKAQRILESLPSDPIPLSE